MRYHLCRYVSRVACLFSCDALATSEFHALILTFFLTITVQFNTIFYDAVLYCQIKGNSSPLTRDFKLNNRAL